MSSRVVAYALVALLVSVAGLAVASKAGAATYTRPCSTSGVWDPDTCERAEATAVAAEDAATQVRDWLEIVAVGVWFLFGGVLALIVAPMMQNSFRWFRP